MPSTNPWLGGLGLALLTSLIAAFVLAAPAHAAGSHPFLYELDGGNTPAESFEFATGTVVDSQGDVYVSDYSHEVIDVFDSAGTYLTQITSICGALGVAVDSDGNLYAIDECSGNVIMYTPDNYPFVGTPTYTGPTTIDASESAFSLAVDPSNDHVYVARRGSEEIVEYKSAAEGSGVVIGSAAEEVGTIEAVGIDVYGANHDIYVTVNSSPGTVQIFDGTTGALKQTIEGPGPSGPNPPGELFGSFATSYLAVDQSNGDVYVSDISSHKVIDQFTSAGVFVSQIGPNFGPSLSLEFSNSEPDDIAVDPTTGDIFVTSEEAVFAFGPLVEEFELTIDKTGTGSGTVTSVQSGTNGEPIDCGSRCAETYEADEVVELEAEAEVGSEFTGWTAASGDPGTCTGTTSPCEVTMSEAIELEAGFDLQATQKSLAIDTTTGTGTGAVNCEVNGGTVDEPCATNYLGGTELKLIPVPSAHSEFVEFENGTGSAIGCFGGSCEFTITEATTVDATFDAIPQFTLAVTKAGTGSGTVTSSPPGINCGVDCSEPYDEGEVVTLTATAGGGSTFAGWSGAGCSGTGTCVVTMSAAANVTATFNIAIFSLSVVKAGSGSGTVTSSPSGINCGSECQHAYNSGTVVTLTATAGGGSTFAGWSGAGCSGTGTCVVTMSAAKEATATFTPISQTLTITKSGTGTGSVTCNGTSCAASYNQGTLVTLAATPASGSSFAGWSGAGCSGTGTCVVTMSANTAVTATFNANPVVPPPTCATNPSLCTPPLPGVATVAGTAPVKGGKALLKISCPGPGACTGTLKLFAKLKQGAKTKSLLIGKASFSLAAGASETLKVKIANAQAKRLLKQGKTLKAKVKGTGVKPGTVKLKPAG